MQHRESAGETGGGSSVCQQHSHLSLIEMPQGLKLFMQAGQEFHMGKEHPD